MGKWKNNEKEGQGIYFYKTGEKFEGNYSCGKKSGKGVWTYRDLSKYEGNFNNFNFLTYIKVHLKMIKGMDQENL